MPNGELSNENRLKLDGIVQKMIQNNEKEEDVQFVVNDFKSKYSSTPKKKEPTVSLSEQAPESTTLDIPKVTEQKPLVSSSSKDEGVFEYKGRPGAIYKKTDEGGWQVDPNNTGVFKDITDSKRISILEKNATPSFRKQEDLIGFKETPKVEVKKELTAEESSAQKAFAKDFKSLSKTDPTVIAKNQADKKTYNVLKNIDSEIVSASEGEVVPRLKNMFKGTDNDIFNFEETGAGYDAIKVTNKLTGESKEISLDNWSSGRDSDESKLLKGFIDVSIKFKDQAYNLKKLQDLERLKQNQLPIEAINTQKQIDELQKDIDIDNKLKQNYAIDNGVYTSSAIYNKEAVNNTKAKFARANIDAVELKTQKKDLEKWKKKADESLASGAISQEEYNNVYMPKIISEENDIVEKANKIKKDITSLQKESQNLDIIAGHHITAQEERGNILTGTTKSFIKGVESPFLTIIAQNMDNPAEAKRLILEATSPGIVTDEYLKSANRNDFETAVFGLTESIGTALVGGPASGASMFVSSYGNYKDEINSTPGMENVPEYEKMLLSATLAAPASILEKFGVDKLMQKSPIGKKFTNWILSKAVSSLPKKASSEMLEKAISENLKTAIGRGIINVAANGVIEGFTEGAEQLVEGTIKTAYNALKDKEYFDTPKTAGEWLDSVTESAKIGLIGGSTVGAMAQSFTIASDKMTAVDFDKMANAIEDENLKDILKTSLKAKVLSGEVSKIKAKEILDNMTSNEAVLKQMPSNLKPEDKYEAFKLIDEKTKLTKEIAGKDEALVSKQTDRVKAINEELKVISNKPEEDATKESEQPIQEISTESNISQYQRAEGGQQEIGKTEGSERTTTQPEANISDSNIPSEAEVVDYTSKTDKELYDIQSKYEESENENEQQMFSDSEKELERREKDKVFSAPLNEVSNVLDELRLQEKNMPNGFGIFTDLSDLSESKKVVERYLNPEKLSDREVESDFMNALRGNPKTWYADGLKLRESVKESGNRGISFEDLISKAKQIYINDGYDVKVADEIIASKLAPIFGEQQTAQAPTTKVEEEANISDSNISSEAEVEQATFEDVASADNAGELARLYIEEVNSQSSVNAKDRAIHSVISKVNKDSYLRFGDASNISMGMAKTYFNKAGQSVDQVAQDASSLLTDDASTDAITPQDIIEYINKYQGGFNPTAPSGNAKLKAINEKNIELTGKGLNSNIARVRANSIGREVEVEAIDSQIVRAMETSGLLSVMEDNINDEGFWTTFPGGFTKEEYELIKKEYNETSREELTRIESEIQSRANWDTEDAIIRTDVISEGEGEATFEEVKDLDTADKTNLQKVQSFLDKAISDLDQFGKETLGMNLPVATARIILRAVKVLVDAGVSLENALKQVATENNVTVNDVVDTLTALSEKKKESEASKAAKKISVTPKTKVTVNEKTALKEQIKLEARAAKEGYRFGKNEVKDALNPIIKKLKKDKKDLKESRKNLELLFNDLIQSGKINAKQAGIILKKFNEVNFGNQISIDNFLNYSERVFNKADYAEKLSESNKLKRSISKLRKTKAATLNKLAQEFHKIDPSLASDIELYIEKATLLKDALMSNRTSTSNVISGIVQTFKTELKTNKAIDINSMKEYISDMVNEQYQQNLVNAQNRLNEYIDQKIIDPSITLSQYNALIEDLKKSITDAEFEAKSESIDKVIKKELLDRKSIVEQMIQSDGVNPLSGEYVEYTKDQEALIKRLLDSDINRLSKKEIFTELDALDNFLTNGITDGIKKFVAIQDGKQNVQMLIDKKFKATDLKMLFSKSIARFKVAQLDDVSKTLERMFNGVTKGDVVAKALGFIDIRNGAAKTDKAMSILTDKYTNEFKNKKANSKHFFDAYNTYERGVYANLLRSPIGSQFDKDQAFEKRIVELKSTYENLLNSSDSTQNRQGEITKEIFEKLNLDKKGITISEVSKLVDKNNKDAVQWIIDKWSDMLPDLIDKSLGMDNYYLEQEDNYTPDIVRSLISQETKNIGENITETNPFKYDASGKVNTSKAGVLNASTKVGMGNTKYLSLDFDNNNFKKLREALLDINISEGAYKMQSALSNNEELIKIFPNASDLNLIKRKMFAYVNNVKGMSSKDGIDLKLVDNILSRLAKAGTSLGLSAISQIPTQYLGAALNTMTQVGEFIDYSQAWSKDANDFIDRTGRPISVRGSEATSVVENSVRYIENNPDTWYKKIDSVAGDITNQYLKWFLQNPDKSIARTAFLAYYAKSLKKQGLNYKNLDYKNLEVNDTAADYAESMVSRQQNTSDQYSAGLLHSNKTTAIKILRNTLFPFARFAINQHSRMVNDVVILSKFKKANKEDLAIAARSLAGWASEQAMFHVIGYSVTQLLMNAFSDEDEDEAEKRKLFENKNRLAKVIGDVLSPVPQVNDVINFGINQALSSQAIGSIIGTNTEIDKAIDEINKKRIEDGLEEMSVTEEFDKRDKLRDELSYKLSTFQNKNDYGVYGVAYEKYNDFRLLFNDNYDGKVEVPKYGGEGTVTKYLIPSDRDKLLVPLVMDAVYLSGAVRLRELHKFSSIKRKELERKRSLTAKEYDIYMELKKDKKFDTESYQFDLIKSGMSLDNIKYDIEWIESKGGMNNKEAKEYFKLDEYNRKEYGQGVDDNELNMILKGKTFNQIIKKQ